MAAACEQINGKALSYINLLDAAGAYTTVAEFTDPSAVVVKHANPCGAAVGSSAADAYNKAYETDPTSAFGGIIAFNGTLDAVIDGGNGTNDTCNTDVPLEIFITVNCP